MTRSDILDKVLKVLENSGIAPKELKPNASLINDLGLDSLDVAELILSMELAFDLTIPIDQENRPIHTINDLTNTIEILISKRKLS